MALAGQCALRSRFGQKLRVDSRYLQSMFGKTEGLSLLVAAMDELSTGEGRRMFVQTKYRRSANASVEFCKSLPLKN